MRRISLLLASLIVVIVSLTGTFSVQASALSASQTTPKSCTYTKLAEKLSPQGWVEAVRWKNNCTGWQHEEALALSGSPNDYYVDISNSDGGFADNRANIQYPQVLNTSEIPPGSSWTLGCAEDVTNGANVCA